MSSHVIILLLLRPVPTKVLHAFLPFVIRSLY
jgi:hypothetical protein